MKTQTFCKQKTASVSLRWRSFYGRGWITRAAHLKKPRRGFFPRRTVRRVDAVRIHPPSLREGYYKTETPVPGSDTGVLGGRGWITQAALLKTAHRAVFAPSSATGPQLFESARLASGKVITKQKLQYPVRILEFLVGAGGFEPPKLKSSRFTVCPHWPLGNTPISYLQSSLTACIFYHLKWHLSTTFSTDFLFFCRSLFSCVLPQ